MPLVSVLMPAYKVTAYIAEALDSVFAQTFQDFEVVVVNDGCPDTPALERALEPYRSRIIYVRQQNQGLGAARNTAFRSGTETKYVALLDSDDKWATDYLQVQIEMLERDPPADVVYSDGFIFGDGPGSGRRFMEVFPSRGEVTVEALLNETCLVMVSVLARREMFERVGLFDTVPANGGSADIDMWLRILKAGGRIKYHTQPLVYYRRHAASLSASSLGMCRSFLGVMNKLSQRSDLTPSERQCLERRISDVRAQMFWEEGKAALGRGDAQEAIEKLAQANGTLQNPRLGLLLAALRACPQPTIQAYRLRKRFLGRSI